MNIEIPLPTEKEHGRHVPKKKLAELLQCKCLYPPCTYASKREANCQKHTEKAHGWEYVRSKSNGRKKGSGETVVPQEPYFNDNVPTTPFSAESFLPFEDVVLDPEVNFFEFTGWSSPDFSVIPTYDEVPNPRIFEYPPLGQCQITGDTVSSPENEGEATELGPIKDHLYNFQANAEALKLEQHNKESTLYSSEKGRPPFSNGANEWDTTYSSSTQSSPYSVEPTAREKPSGTDTPHQSIQRIQTNATGKVTPSQQAPQPKDAVDKVHICPIKSSETKRLKRKELPQPREKRRLMSCIFRKFKPDIYNYGTEKFKTCHTTSHQYISTLVRHLERYHESIICHHCLQTFASQDLAKNHKAAQNCPSVSGSQEVKWQILYEKLCGDGIRHDPGFDSAGDKRSSTCHQDESCKKARLDSCLQVGDEAKLAPESACSQKMPRPQLATPQQTPASTPQIPPSCSIDERKELKQLREENTRLLRENNMLLRRLLQLESEPKGLG